MHPAHQFAGFACGATACAAMPPTPLNRHDSGRAAYMRLCEYILASQALAGRASARGLLSLPRGRPNSGYQVVANGLKKFLNKNKRVGKTFCASKKFTKFVVFRLFMTLIWKYKIAVAHRVHGPSNRVHNPEPANPLY